jgi:hypothetical protein
VLGVRADLASRVAPSFLALAGDFTVKRLVRDAWQGAKANAETITVGGDGCRLHVERNRAIATAVE